MTLLVRDEEDIIKHNIEYHLSQGIDFFIVMDNKSVDSTKKILLEYEQQGKLHYIFQPEDNFHQREWVTHMARLACTDYNADWIINNDADEFWWPMKGNLKSTFESIAPHYNTVLAQRHNFSPSSSRGGYFYSNMIYRETQSLNGLGRRLPPKVAHRALSNISVRPGNHQIDGFDEQYIIENEIEILHYPLRSYSQFSNKISQGGAAYERNTTVGKNVGNVWKTLYKEYCKTGTLQAYYQSYCYDGENFQKR